MLVNKSGRLLGNIARCIQVQQIKLKHSFKLRTGLGAVPMITEDQYLEASEAGRLESLAFERIRFCKSSEISSLLFDPVHEKFANIVMKDGRKWLAYKLMHETFYHIKMIQYRKYMKRKRQEAEQPADKQADLLMQLNQEEEVIELDPMRLFKEAVENCKPSVVTMDVKRGGVTFKVPSPIPSQSQEWLAMKWLVSAVKERPKRRVKLFPEVMANELIDAYYNRGKVVKKRNDIHKLAEANKAFAHYRWS